MNYLTKSILCPLLILSLLISGCVTRPDVNLTPVKLNHVEQATAWEMQGKLAVNTPQDKFSTNLYWLHTENKDELRLTTMLGTTVMSLSSSEQGAVLILDGKTYRDDNPEQLLNRLSGWSIPIALLPQWITGQLSPKDRVLSRDSEQRPQAVQSYFGHPPWQVTFKTWQTQSGAQLPKLLELTRKDIRLKIQISQWQALAERAILPLETPERVNEQ